MNSMNRLEALRAWLAAVLPEQVLALEPASSDASFRRYFRVTLSRRTLIAMDAPPDREDCRPFVNVAALFRTADVHVPEILAQDLEQGFLLLTDLGNDTYLQRLTPATAPALYADAIDALVAIQKISRPGVLPDYDQERLLTEMRLFPEWYLKVHCELALTEQEAARLEGILAMIAEQVSVGPQVFVHRDYHSRNLMVCSDNPGILDFQDAVLGPASYDLVSLLRDAYIAWEEESVIDWTIGYWQKARAAGIELPTDFGQFWRQFEWMGVQRHLKVLGIFARLYHRDGKDGYLKDMPLVARYLRAACERYDELKFILRLLDRAEQNGAVR